MSLVTDQVRLIDARLDRLQLGVQARLSARDATPADLKGAAQVQAVIKLFSAASASGTLLAASRTQALLRQAAFSGGGEAEAAAAEGEGRKADEYSAELEWLLVGKATAQVYGLVLETLLRQIGPLSGGVWYWDEVLGSYAWSSFYALQTSPLRLLAWSREVYGDARRKLDEIRSGEFQLQQQQQQQQQQLSLGERWSRFYGLVKQSVRERSTADLQSRVMSPVTKCRIEARKRQKLLLRYREMSACGLGMLMDEGLSLDASSDDDDSEVSSEAVEEKGEWKTIVSKSILLMETVLRNVSSLDKGVQEFEDRVFATVEVEASDTKPDALSQRLLEILEVTLPEHGKASAALLRENGRPSALIRYWIPGLVFALSGTTALRILVRRQAEITQWIRDLGTTTRDFWFNWIVDPVKKIIGTIRHDKDSEIALMSRESLEGDRASLERMVVDFAVDNPPDGALSTAEVETIRAKVKEGDLTPVLKAYEKDLKRPFMGTVRGELVRALLIQIQKTKVDVEIAIGGIDALLKSQELVFGFVGLTPGILVFVGLTRWLFAVGDTGGSTGDKQIRMVRVLRNIDRIFTSCSPSENGLLSYKEHGLLLCEAQVLRQDGEAVFPSELKREFLQDLADLVDVRIGVQRQTHVLQRIWRAYDRWLR